MNNEENKDSKQEFNARIGADNLQQQLVELETKIIKMEGLLGGLQAKLSERFEYIDKVVGLYKSNIEELDKQKQMFVNEIIAFKDEFEHKFEDLLADYANKQFKLVVIDYD